MIVKANMPTLYRQLKKLPCSASPLSRSLARPWAPRPRTIKTVLSPA